jgi:hypothetical protein
MPENSCIDSHQPEWFNNLKYSLVVRTTDMTEYSVDSIDVVSLAKILGVIGLLWGIILAMGWIAPGGPMGGRPGLPELLIAIIGGALYGVIGGAITAVIYNAAAGLVGGIELEVS